jgi:hypothetical protein
MTTDPYKIIRSIAAILPECRYWLVFALVLGGGVEALTVLFQPYLKGLPTGYVKFDDMTYVRWFFLAAIVLAPVYWPVWLIFRYSKEGRRRQAALRYVDMMDEAARALDLPKAASNRAKERFLNELADSLARGGFVPALKGLEGEAAGTR